MCVHKYYLHDLFGWYEDFCKKNICGHLLFAILLLILVTMWSTQSATGKKCGVAHFLFFLFIRHIIIWTHDPPLITM